MTFQLCDENRTPGDFSVAPIPGYKPTGDEEECIEELKQLLTELGAITDDGTVRGEELVEHRQAYQTLMRDYAQQFTSGKITAKEFLLIICECKGAFQESVKYLKTCTILVRPDVDHNNSKMYADITYEISPGVVTKEQIELKRNLDKALTVVKVVLSGNHRDQQIKRHEYIKGLVGIGRIGLMDGSMDFAKATLETFKDEFVAREAQHVKNHYVRRLGICALIFVAFLGVCYVLISNDLTPTLWTDFPGGFLYKVRNFFLVANGAALGAWLAFLIRRPTLGFTDLVQMDDDLLNPVTRVLFTIALALVIGLVFWTGMVAISIGNFSTAFEESAATAILIGAFCGLASRVLATAVTRRAEDFAGNVGGNASPAAGGQNS